MLWEYTSDITLSFYLALSPKNQHHLNIAATDEFVSPYQPWSHPVFHMVFIHRLEIFIALPANLTWPAILFLPSMVYFACMRIAKNRILHILVPLFLACYVQMTGQNLPRNSSIEILPTSDPVKIDGVLNESVWGSTVAASGFQQTFPTDSFPAISETEVLLTYDDHYLYIAAVCHDTLSRDYVITSLRRDFDFRSNDNFSVYIDPFNDHTNGFTFSLSPLGIQREGLISDGDDISTDWDNKWFSAVQRYGDRWTLEMAIPFKSIRYNPSNLTWNINFLRNNQKQNERTSWIRVPQQYRSSNLAFSGKLIWQSLPENAGPNIVLIPFISSSVAKDHQTGTSTEYKLDGGMDAKVAVTTSLNLDLTINPDFSQVEVDEQVTNLDRFEIFFPEKRQFFLENSDLFSEFGFPSVRPFFSRRIGIAQDTAGNNILVPIRYGVRLSGKVNRDWRVGILNMQTAGDRDNMLNAQNYTVATFQRRVFARSNIGGIFVNRQATDYRSSDSLGSSRFNRVFGVDYNLLSANNRWEGNTFYHRSDNPGSETGNYVHGMFLRYASRNIRVFWFHQIIGESYEAQVGFVRRSDIRLGTLDVRATLYPQDPRIVNHQPSIRVSHITDGSYSLTDREINFEHEINFTNGSELQVRVDNNWIKLIDPFDPSGSDGLELLAGSEYQWWRGAIGYRSDNRKLFNFEIGTSYGGFFNGKLMEVEMETNYRFQPYGGIGIKFSYNRVNLPDPFNDANLYLIGPKIDLTLNDHLFFTTFLQYNNQQDNLNINSRAQWRFAPISDLFIVYTDNYFPNNLQAKNRALVIKLSYWFNV